MTDHELLVAIHEDVSLLKARVVRTCEDVEAIKKDVYGNGSKGMKATLAEHIVRHDERQQMFRWLASIGGGGGIVGTIAGMIALFK